MLELGAVGRLLVSGELQDVLPAEDAELLDAANPVQTDGSVRYDAAAVEQREDAIVRAMLHCPKLAIIILGGDHDLGDNIERFAGGTCAYVRVQTKRHHTVVEGER